MVPGWGTIVLEAVERRLQEVIISAMVWKMVTRSLVGSCSRARYEEISKSKIQRQNALRFSDEKTAENTESNPIYVSTAHQADRIHFWDLCSQLRPGLYFD